ncbi:hypothetical protein DPMN_118073 [Dreissena polymorpha]|uniref:Uncharacterized protein n=1 Tax=Dreissena polymorpha TaxID=45954 RepID=A0A9D4GFS7_DREPO|nr:hypothetical protein DPMN_118073 [Dreissena polymorpha]
MGIRDGGKHREVENHGEHHDQHKRRHHHVRRVDRISDPLQVLGPNPVQGTSTAEVRIIITMATAAMTRHSRLLTSSSISFATK